MVMMASARDLVSIFVALELLSIPAYMLAAWRKRDEKSNEAGMKYFLLGVFASAVMLYGMSLLYGVAGTTLLTGIGRRRRRERQRRRSSRSPSCSSSSASPSRCRPCRSTPGRPTPTRAPRRPSPRSCRWRRRRPASWRCSRSSSSASRRPRTSTSPCSGCCRRSTMTVGNVLALRQTNIVRMLAYSSIAQGGFILMPLAVAGDRRGPGRLAAGRDHLPDRLRGHEPRRLRRRHRRGPQDPLGRDLQLRRPVQLRARPGHGHDDLPGLAGRHPAARRLDRQVRRVQGRPRRRAPRPARCWP